MCHCPYSASMHSAQRIKAAHWWKFWSMLSPQWDIIKIPCVDFGMTFKATMIFITLNKIRWIHSRNPLIRHELRKEFISLFIKAIYSQMLLFIVPIGTSDLMTVFRLLHCAHTKCYNNTNSKQVDRNYLRRIDVYRLFEICAVNVCGRWNLAIDHN